MGSTGKWDISCVVIHYCIAFLGIPPPPPMDGNGGDFLIEYNDIEWKMTFTTILPS
jgi:hypothetical protein